MPVLVDDSAGRLWTGTRTVEGFLNQNFMQTMTVRCNDPEVLVSMAAEWDSQQAAADIMGFMGTRVLADRDDPGRYVIIADFGVVDPDVSAVDEATRNNERPETQASAARLRDLVGEIEFHHYDELYRTEFYGI
jgi:heme-degrading monooxygenase HmoA